MADVPAVSPGPKPPDQPGDMILHARVSAKSFIPAYFLWAVVASVVLVLGFKLLPDFNKLILTLLAIAPLVIHILHSLLVRITTEYRVFEDSIEVETGFIARKIENVQLFRVRDIGLGQGVIGRILDFGSVSLASTDHSSPHLVLRGIDHPMKLYQTLREQTAKSQAARRTMIVEGEEGLGPAGHDVV